MMNVMVDTTQNRQTGRCIAQMSSHTTMDETKKERRGCVVTSMFKSFDRK